jgi:hypothetical protein
MCTWDKSDRGKGIVNLNSGFDIVVKKVNEATVFVDCRTSIQRELTTFFSVFADNYRFNPKYKQGVWDGRLRFFDYKNNLPIGLCAKLNNFAKQGRYTIKYDFELGTKVDLEEFTAFVAALKITDDEGNPMEPRDFQLRAAYDALCKNHLNIASSTASGKSLILYMIVRWLMAHDEKTICIVPSVQLVEQLYGDFLSYGWQDVESYCSRIYSGKVKFPTKQYHDIELENGEVYKGLLGSDFIKTINRNMVSMKHLTKEDEIDYEWFRAMYRGKQI